MATHLYTISWNEADMLGFFFRHYDPWVDRYIIYDDGSTDGTLDLLRAHPRVEVRRFERTVPDSFVALHLALQDHAWKESRGSADWVVITAIDEHLWVPGSPMADYLVRARRGGITYLPAMGYQMVSVDFPESGETLCLSRTHGAPFVDMSKLSVFDPSAIEETNYAPGRHYARPRGRLRLPRRDEMLLLHYKCMGFERLVARRAMLSTGLGDLDRTMGWGVGYYAAEEAVRAEWDAFASRTVDVGRPGLRQRKTHRCRRWWRPRWWRGLHRWGIV